MPVNHTPISEQDAGTQNRREKKEKEIVFWVSEPKYSFSDIILSDEIRTEIDRVLSLTKNYKLIFEEWGLGSVVKHNNLSVNLYGPSGTGKTMTAHAIAGALHKKLVVVNYAELESKYVGETSKNLVRLFEFAKCKDAVILFDEADAVLSKRVSSMHSATDVSVNQTRNMLLKLLDDYEGVVIFTTNFIQNFDAAFMRRIFTHIKFTLPDFRGRKGLWSYYFTDLMPLQDRSGLIEEISKIEDLSGSDISTAVLKAAIDAANSSCRIITFEMVKRIIGEVQEAKQAVVGKYEISTRKVSEEYALQKIGKGEIINGNH